MAELLQNLLRANSQWQKNEDEGSRQLPFIKGRVRVTKHSKKGGWAGRPHEEGYCCLLVPQSVARTAGPRASGSRQPYEINKD